jgi:hypothetical protein
MKIVIQLNYTDLQHLNPLFQELYQRFPTGWVRLGERENGCTLDVQPYKITPDDRQFFKTLQEKHLISSWFHDPS